jgi:hypothetical protein
MAGVDNSEHTAPPRELKESIGFLVAFSRTAKTGSPWQVNQYTHPQPTPDQRVQRNARRKEGIGSGTRGDGCRRQEAAGGAHRFSYEL